MTGKSLKYVLSVMVFVLLCTASAVRADIFNPFWESPSVGPDPTIPGFDAVSGLQAFRGHVSSTTTTPPVAVTVRLLIPSLSITLQLPWGTDRSDVAPSGPDRFSGFGDVLNVANLPPGPVAMTIEMREGGGTGECIAPTCFSETRTFTVIKPGARAGEIAQFRFGQDFALFADLTNPSIPAVASSRPSNVATDLATSTITGGPDIIIAPITIQDSGGAGFRTVTLRQRWVQNTQSFEIISAATSDNTRFSAVQGILGAKCGVTGCHVVGGALPLPGSQILNNSTDSFFNTVAVRSLENPQMLRITPGDPTNSYLYQKVIEGGTITGQRMPLGCSGASCLSASEINVIGDWILNGAPPPSP